MVVVEMVVVMVVEMVVVEMVMMKLNFNVLYTHPQHIISHYTPFGTTLHHRT